MESLKGFLEEVVLGAGKPLWPKFFYKLGAYFNKRFGPDWKERDKFFKEFEESLRHSEQANALEYRSVGKWFDLSLSLNIHPHQGMLSSRDNLIFKKPPDLLL